VKERAYQNLKTLQDTAKACEKEAEKAQRRKDLAWYEPALRAAKKSTIAWADDFLGRTGPTTKTQS
jgi:hypothetical protein